MATKLPKVLSDRAGGTRPQRPCRPLRIAYVVYRFGIGGAERCVARLVSHLDRSRFHCAIIALTEAPAPSAWIDTDRVPVVPLRKRPGNDVRVVAQLAAVLSELGIDLVHSHNWGTLLETWGARRLAGTPLHVHAERGTVLDALDFQSLRLKLRGVAARLVLAGVDAVIAPAQSIAQRLQRACGFPAHLARIIPNGVDPPEDGREAAVRSAARAELGLAPGDILIGSVGRLHPVKGFEILLKAFAQIRGAHPWVHLVLIGDGPERPHLLRLAQELRAQAAVHILGERADVGRWLAAMDIYVNSSHSEGLSQAVLEAMTCGLPLVCTSVGDHGPLVSSLPACGIVVPPRDVEALVQALNQLVESPELRRTFGMAALKRYEERFTVQRMVEAYEALYQHLAHRKGLWQG